MSELLNRAKELVAMLEAEENKNKIKLSDIPVGGKFDTGIGRFIVLEQQEDKTLVITDNLYFENKVFDGSCTDYKESEIRKLCESEVYDKFASEFGAENIIPNVADLTTVDGQKVFGECLTTVRPLTFDEGRKYNDYLPNEEIPQLYFTCTAWSTAERDWPYSVVVVSPSGGFSRNCYNYDRGVRPFCILKSNIFVSKAAEE